MPPFLQDPLAILMLVASLVGSLALCALLCALPPKWFSLEPKKPWRIAGAILGLVLGLLIAPVSFITFGWFGAASGAYIGEWTRSTALGRGAMVVLVPISVSIGAALLSMLFAAVVFAIASAILNMARRSGVRPSQ